MTERPHDTEHERREGDDPGTEGDRGGKLELRLWLRLLGCSNLIESTVRTNLRHAFDTTLPRFDLLAQLYRAPEGVTMGELSKRLMVSNGNVTMVMDRLEAEGLVARLPSPSDRRTQYAHLTDRGRKAFMAMAGVHESWIEDLFAGLTQEEMQILLVLLSKLKRSLEAHEPQTGEDA